MDPNALIGVFLITLCVTGAFYALFYARLSGQDIAEKRKAQFKKNKAKNDRERSTDLNKRRQQIAESIRDMESALKKRKARSVDNMIEQAGLEWSKQQFYIGSAIAGVLVGTLVFFVNGNPLIALAGVFVGGVGLPRWVISFLSKRRMRKFLEEFPGAVDVIIRGVKAGLPIGQCLGIIAAEAAEPVRSEFRRIIEAQSIGLSVAESVDRLPERVPLAETSFFAIVINLQQKSGGNLSEALGNLSRVLRDRKKMRQKIIAMSSEAKASAMIIGALPFLVSGLVYITAPDYIRLLFVTTTGQIVLGISAFWMAVGVAVMKKLVNFDF